MTRQTPQNEDHRLLTVIGMVAVVLLFLVGMQGFVLVETYELSAFEAHRSCVERRASSCERLLPPWQAQEREPRTLRARFAGALGGLGDLTLDAAHAAKSAAGNAIDALTLRAQRT